MDEFPLFRSDLIDALRQPLESGDITIARRDESITLPAGGMLVLASNPCPCGNWTSRARSNRCQCAVPVRRAYQARMSGPIADRIDIVRNVQPMTPSSHDPFRIVETSAEVRERVGAARERQRRRFSGCSWRLNSQIPSPRLKAEWAVDESAQRLLDQESYRGTLSARGAVRVLRLAWTVADLASIRAGRDIVPGVDEVETALRLRTGDALDVRVVRGLDHGGTTEQAG